MNDSRAVRRAAGILPRRSPAAKHTSTPDSIRRASVISIGMCATNKERLRSARVQFRARSFVHVGGGRFSVYHDLGKHPPNADNHRGVRVTRGVMWTIVASCVVCLSCVGSPETLTGPTSLHPGV